MKREIKGMFTGLGVTLKTMMKPPASPSTWRLAAKKVRSDEHVVRRGERSAAQRTRGTGERPRPEFRRPQRVGPKIVVAENIFFGIIAAAMVIGALGVVSTKNI